MAGLLPPPAARRIMPTVPDVMHIIDVSTPRDSLDQLSLLAGEDDTVVSIGPAPPNVCRALSVTAVRRPLGSAALAGYALLKLTRGETIVHAWSGPAAGAAGHLLKARGCGLVVSLVAAGAVEDEQVARLSKALRAGRTKATLTVPTESARRVLLKRGLPAEAAAVLAPAVEPVNEPDQRRRRMREQLGLSDQEVLLVAPAEMTRWAGHKYASWVHGILRQTVDHVRLMLPGTGPVERHVRFFAETTGYDDEVFLTRGRFALGDVLAAADIAVFFQQRDCGVGTLAAAMSAGLPVVSSGTHDACELIRDGQTGLLTPRRNPRGQTAAVLRLIDEPDLARRLGAAAAESARERFRRQDVRAHLEEIYASVTDS